MAGRLHCNFSVPGSPTVGVDTLGSPRRLATRVGHVPAGGFCLWQPVQSDAPQDGPLVGWRRPRSSARNAMSRTPCSARSMRGSSPCARPGIRGEATQAVMMYIFFGDLGQVPSVSPAGMEPKLQCNRPAQIVAVAAGTPWETAVTGPRAVLSGSMVFTVQPGQSDYSNGKSGMQGWRGRSSGAGQSHSTSAPQVQHSQVLVVD